MSRPTVDVVVPFVGSDAERRVLVDRMSALDFTDGDTLTIVDNGPTPPGDLGASPVVVHAPERPTSYHARNVGARRGSADWILFLDADVFPAPGLLERCFAAPLPERAGIIAGGIRDEMPARPQDAPLAARYAALRAPMSDERTLHHPRGYAQTANAAFRRTVFEAAGGFDERARSGGDADLCFRLADAGWALLHRPEALVVHRNRASLRALLRQRVRHGAGSAWVDRRHPGTMPARDTRAFVAHQLADTLRQALRLRREEATMALIDVLVGCAYLLGRRLGNEPQPGSGGHSLDVMAESASDMRAFWDERAREDALFFVDDRVEYGKADVNAFFAGGAEAVAVFETELGFRAEGDRLVDIGCGVGRLTRVLAGRAGEVMAIDVSAEMLALAEQHNPQLTNVAWTLGDGVSLAGVGDGWADGVFSHVVFQHIPDPAITLGYVREMGRVLAPGGWAAFQVSDDPNVHDAGRTGLRDRVHGWLRRGPRGRTNPAWVGSAVRVEDVRRTADAAGLDVVTTAGEGSQYCLIRLRRR